MTSDPHSEPLTVTEHDGLHLPHEYIGHDGGLVVRTPSGLTVDSKPREWGGMHPSIRPRHFGRVNEDAPNSHLREFEVELKKYGMEREVFGVEPER